MLLIVNSPILGEQRLPKKRIVSITMDEDVLAWVDKSATGTGMSRSEFINFVLSGGRDSTEMLDMVIDKWANQKVTKLKDALLVSVKTGSRLTKKEER